MPIIRTLPSVVADYEAHDAINQSGLKDIMFNGIQSYLFNKDLSNKTEEYFEDKEHFLIGKAADVLMSFGEDAFKNVYHVSSEDEKPSDTMMRVLHMTLQHIVSLQPTQIFPLEHEANYPILHKMLNSVQTKGDKGEIKVGYYMNRAKDNWVDDGRMKDVLKPECVAYWKDIVLSRGKQVLSSNEKSIIDQVTNNWKTHQNTSYLFTEDPDIYQVYQFPVFFILNSVWCKGLLDKIDINIRKETITIFDFKTMKGYTLNFGKVIRTRRYDFQLAFYFEGLRQSLKSLSQFIGLDVTGYTMMNPICIVESTNNPGTPIQAELSDSLLYVGERGDNNLLPGYAQMINEYEYWKNRDFDVASVCYHSTTPGRLVIDSQFMLIKP